MRKIWNKPVKTAFVATIIAALAAVLWWNDAVSALAWMREFLGK